MALPTNEIESELSYAYLHAIASRAGLNCKYENRHGDNYSVDAVVDYFAPIPNIYRTDVSLRIQLKATTNKGAETATHFPFFFKGIDQYNRMRTNKGEPHRILIVLYLPQDATTWLTCTPDELVLKYSAYWVGLYEAPASANATGETIYIPKANRLTTDSLIKLCQNIGLGNIPTYQIP